MKHFAVTGATGFVGQRLCRWLKRLGYTVTGVSTSTQDPGPNSDCIDSWLYTPTLEDCSNLDGRLTGIDAVVHLAALVHQNRQFPYEMYHRANVVGTQALIDAAANCGIRRFVYVSTVKVNGESTVAGEPFDVQSKPDPVGPYALSKLRAEEIVSDRGASNRIETVILRPVLIYGPGVGANFLRLISLVQRRWPLPFARIRNARSILFVDNFCDLILTCLEQPGATGRTFFAADAHAVSTPELIREIALALGFEPRMYSVPPAIIRSFAAAFGQKDRVGRLLESLEVSLEANSEILGWSPKVSTRTGIRQTIESMAHTAER